MKEIIRATLSVTSQPNDLFANWDLLQGRPFSLCGPLAIDNGLLVLIIEPESRVPGSTLHFHGDESDLLLRIYFDRIQGVLVCCRAFEQRRFHSILKYELNSLQVLLVEVLFVSDLSQNKVVRR